MKYKLRDFNVNSRRDLTKNKDKGGRVYIIRSKLEERILTYMVVFLVTDLVYVHII